MSIIKDGLAARAGRKQAAIDAAKIDAWNAKHDERHEKDPNFDCHASKQAMEYPMRENFEEQGILWKAAYSEYMVNYYKGAKKNLAESKNDAQNRVEELAKRFPGMNFLAVELDGDETEEELQAKALRAIQTDEAFRNLGVEFGVSETDDDKKGE